MPETFGNCLIHSRSKATLAAACLARFPVLVVSLVISAAAHGGDATPPGQLRDLCVDRPGKGTSACTVDAGHLQIEADMVNGTFADDSGASVHTYLYANPTIKFGVSDNVDLEANLAPFVDIRTKDKSSGATTTARGIGDLFLRAKVNVHGNDGGAFGFAFEPYVKLPTARSDVGNGAVEGGLVVPLSLQLDDSWSVSATPELDVLQNADDHGRHAALSNVVGIGRAVGDGISVGAELWALADLDPSGRSAQYSFDLSGAWQPDGEPDLQLDGGVNFGLNDATPDLQVYAGVSRRL